VHPLAGIERKLDRGEEHLDTLGEAIERFRQDNPYEPIVEADDQTGDSVLRIYIRNGHRFLIGPFSSATFFTTSDRASITLLGSWGATSPQ
jgi:hypothetical protein